ncbi:MAG: hypothetical protein RIM99_13240 [Cyclobacteriaceae bacterium]
MAYSAKEALRILRIIHFSLMMGPAFFATVVFYLTVSGSNSQDPVEILTYVPGALFILSLPLSDFMFKMAKKELKNKSDLKSKVAVFQTAQIIRMAILEMCALFSAVVALINGDIYQLIVVALVIVFMAIKTPSVLMLETELELSQEEKSQFQTG